MPCTPAVRAPPPLPRRETLRAARASLRVNERDIHHTPAARHSRAPHDAHTRHTRHTTTHNHRASAHQHFFTNTTIIHTQHLPARAPTPAPRFARCRHARIRMLTLGLSSRWLALACSSAWHASMQHAYNSRPACTHAGEHVPHTAAATAAASRETRPPPQPRPPPPPAARVGACMCMSRW